jgi:hypothetical protein
VSANNQGNLSEKASAPQSLLLRLRASSRHADRDRRDRNGMEHTMALHQEIRRHTDGSIDIDFYRQRARAEHRAAKTRFFDARGKAFRPLAAAAVIGAVLTAVLSSAGPVRTDPSVTAITSGDARSAYPETTARLPSRVLTR